MAKIPAAIERHNPLSDDCDSFLGCAACAWAEGHAAGVQAGRAAAATAVEAGRVRCVAHTPDEPCIRCSAYEQAARIAAASGPVEPSV